MAAGHLAVPATDRLRNVEKALAAFARGGFVVVFDDESRENEGDLMVAAEFTDEVAMKFMLDHTSGVVCAALPHQRCAELELPQMVAENSGLHGTAFTVSVDLKRDGSTGISAVERARTVRALADPAARPGDFARPGHIFPVRAARGGVRERDGHTEAAVELSLLSGLSGVTTMCEMVRSDWGMSRYGDLQEFTDREGLVMVSVGDIAAYRAAHDEAAIELPGSASPGSVCLTRSGWNAW